MELNKIYKNTLFYLFLILSIFISKSIADEDTLAVIEKLKKDVKTLEKAVYSQSSENKTNLSL